jgi:hypothetical protein
MIFGPFLTSGTLPKREALCVLLALSVPACALIGVEPDEIDVLDDGGSEEGFSGSNEGGDGDGDPGDGDGDGDGEPGDGDGDTGGDGDGDPGGDGDGDQGDGDPGDGDPGDGDGDGTDSGGMDCGLFAPEPLDAGSHMVEIVDGPSLAEGSCGTAGPESVYSYTATADGLVRFELTSSDFDAALYVIGACEPLEEIACVTAPDPLLIEQLMTQGLTYYIVVDSFAGAGTGTLEITLP